MVSSITSINEMLNKAFALAYFIHGDKRTALRIATDAMAKLEVATSAQHKRLYYRPAGRAARRQGWAKRSKVSFSDLHLLQRLVYVESERHEKQREQAGNSASVSEEDMIIHFIKHLVKITLRRNSFYVTLGLSRLLYHYSTAEAMEIYNVVAQDPERVKDDYYYRSRKRLLIGEIMERFGNLIRMSRGPRGEERFQAQDAPELHLDLVKQCLLFFTPWETPCLVPSGFDPTLESIVPFSSEGGFEEDKVEINRIHAILEPGCFERLIEGLGFDAPSARLEVPCFSIAQDSDNNDGPRTGRHVPLRLNEQELLGVKSELSELAARRKRASAGLLRVLVDGIERARLDLNRTDRMRFDIESSAELLEVRGQDAAGEVLLASHLFAHDALGDGFAAYELPVLLEAGQKLLISVTPAAQQGTGEWTGASVSVSCRKSSLARAMTNLARQFGAGASERLLSSRGDYAKTLIPVLASVLLAICLAGVALHMRARRSINDQPVTSNAKPEDIIIPPDDPPTPGNAASHNINTESEAERERASATRGQTAKLMRPQAASQGRELPSRRRAKIATTPSLESGSAVADSNASEIELTRDLNTGWAASSLAEVKKIYIEVASTEDETLKTGLHEDLTRTPRFSRRFIVATEKDDADALLKISVTRLRSINRQGVDEAPAATQVDGNAKEDREIKPTIISVSAQLINAAGKVIWPTGSGVSQKKYQGTVTELAPQIIKDLLDDVDDQ
jgi:hypothetical protein